MSRALDGWAGSGCGSESDEGAGGGQRRRDGYKMSGCSRYVNLYTATSSLTPIIACSIAPSRVEHLALRAVNTFTNA